jgi:hypothetical protein
MGMAVTLLVVAGLIVLRLGGTTTLSPWGIAAVFVALVAGVTGVGVFCLGVTFNYLVSLFSKQPVRQGLFGRPIFKTPLDRQFGWMGVVSTFGGLILGFVSLSLGMQGWEIARLWLYLLGSAMLILTGVQLVIYWILLRVLDELSQRDFNIEKDLRSA